MTWTESRVADLKRLWAEGESCSRVAAIMGGLTRSAVIGKVHRLNLPKRKTKTVARVRETRPSSAYRKPRMFFTPRPKPEPKPAPVPTVEPVSLDVKLMDLGPRQCKWPHGDGPFVFCGHSRPFGEPYCPYHAGRAFNIPEPRHRRRVGQFAKVA